MKEQEIRIKPPASISFDLTELWANRELLYFFTWRDLKVKYKQTYLGILWALLQPLLLMAIFYFVLFRTFKVSVGMSYPVYSFTGLILWGFFSAGITHSSESLIGSAAIIRKIYFPRLLIPLASVLTAFVDFLIAFALLAILLVLFKQPVGWEAVYYFPAAILLAFISSLGMGLLLAALNVKYRDFRYLLPFGIQVLFFSSQVVYSIHSIEPEWLRWLLFCNPLNGALEFFYAPLRGGIVNVTGVAISCGVAMAIFSIGFIYFKKTEAYFADVI